MGLKNIDFSKYFEQNNIEPYTSTSFKQTLEYCDTTYIGSNQSEVGYSKTGKANKICGNLLCLKCDVKISMFKNKKWNDNCDYLFFRNNYGDKIKLSERLIPSNEYVCYSCQCSWLNFNKDITNVENINSVSWTCGGHNIQF